MVAYVNKVLEPDEKISYVARLSWVAYVPSGAVTIVGILLWVLGAQFQVVVYLAWLIILVGIGWIIFTWIKRATTEIVVTDRRVVLKTGLISRRTVEMNLTRIESVDVRQGIPGRILNYGDVLIRGTGAGLEPIRGVDAPLEFRRRVLA